MLFRSLGLKFRRARPGLNKDQPGTGAELPDAERDRAAQVREVAPGGVARGKGTRDDFAGVIVERQDEGGIGVVFRPAVGASLSVS